MSEKKAPQGVKSLEAILKERYGGFDSINRYDILEAVREFLKGNKRAAEACRFETCDDCIKRIKIIDELMERL